MEAKKIYRYEVTDNITVYSEKVVPKEPKSNGRSVPKRSHPVWYDESLSKKLVCRQCGREFIGRTSNGLAYHVDDDCGGTTDDLEFIGDNPNE